MSDLHDELLAKLSKKTAPQTNKSTFEVPLITSRWRDEETSRPPLTDQSPSLLQSGNTTPAPRGISLPGINIPAAEEQRPAPQPQRTPAVRQTADPYENRFDREHSHTHNATSEYPTREAGKYSLGILGEGTVDHYDEFDDDFDSLENAAEEHEADEYYSSNIDYTPHPFLSSLALAMFFPTGFVAAGHDKEVIWYSNLGYDEEARSSAKQSLIWSWVSIALGVILFIAAAVGILRAYGVVDFSNWF